MRSLKFDVSTNLVLSALNTAGVMLLLWMAARVWPAAGLGLFLLIRRLSDTLSHCMHFGAPLAVRRYLTMLPGASERASSFFASLKLSLLGLAATVAAVLVAPEQLQTLLFGNIESGPQLIASVISLSAALVLHYVASSSLLARRQIVASNLLDLTSMVIVPMSSLKLVRGITVVELVSIQSASIASAAAVVLVITGLQLRSATGRSGPATNPTSMFDVARYGFPRATTLFLESGFVVVGPLLLRHDLAMAGYLTVAFILLRLVRTFIQPMTTIAALSLSRLHGRGATGDVSRGLNFLIGATLVGGAVAMAVVLPWSELILTIWLGPTLTPAVRPYVDILLFSVIPLSMLQSLREPIEMIWHTPFTTLIYVLGICLLGLAFWVLSLFVNLGMAASAAYVAAYASMCGTALLVIRRHLERSGYFGLARLTLLTAAAWGINTYVANATTLSSSYNQLLAMSAAAMCSIAGVLVAYFLLFPPQFATDITTYLLPRKSGNQGAPLA